MSRLVPVVNAGNSGETRDGRSCLLPSTIGNLLQLEIENQANPTFFIGILRGEFTCTLLALLRKWLIMNGAGEENRTLVTVYLYIVDN